MKLKDECVQMYEGRKVNCVVTKIEEKTFNVSIVGLGFEMFDIPKEKFNPKYCMPDGIDTKEEHEQYLKDIGYKESDTISLREELIKYSDFLFPEREDNANEVDFYLKNK